MLHLAFLKYSTKEMEENSMFCDSLLVMIQFKIDSLLSCRLCAENTSSSFEFGVFYAWLLHRPVLSGLTNKQTNKTSLWKQCICTDFSENWYKWHVFNLNQGWTVKMFICTLKEKYVQDYFLQWSSSITENVNAYNNYPSCDCKHCCPLPVVVCHL